MKLYNCLPKGVADILAGKNLREIRLRNGGAIKVNVDGQWLWCGKHGLTTQFACAYDFGVNCEKIIADACGGSVYAYENMLAKGYFTLDDGSRFGVAGEQSGKGALFKSYSSICVRVPRCVRCATDKLLDSIIGKNTLLIGRPAVGKTTLLRDVASKLSAHRNVVVVDERGELDIEGVLANCDVLKWSTKSYAFEVAIRSLSPNYICCDELVAEDVAGLNRCLQSGVNLVATLHGDSIDSAKFMLKEVLKAFNTFVLCKAVGEYEILQ